jgi:hypothetical protein
VTVELPRLDDDPAVWRDPEDPDASGLVPTAEETEQGRELGQMIDPDDDYDNGLG